MILLTPLALLMPFFTGVGWMKLRREKERISPGQCYIMGFLTILLIAQITSFIAIKADLSFTMYCRVLTGLMAAGAIISTIIGFPEGRMALTSQDTIPAGFIHLINGRRNKDTQGRSVLHSMEKRELFRIRLETLLIIAVVILQCAAYFIYVPDTGSSTMAETVTVTNATDTLFKYNPVTGALMEQGIYPIYKLSSLPLFYSALYRVSGLDFTTFLYVTIPVWTVCVSMTVMILWGEVLSRGMKERRVLILMFYSVLVLMRSGVDGTYGHLLVHEGFKGGVLFASVLVPLFFCSIYLIAVQKEKLYGGAMAVLCANAMLVSTPLRPGISISDILSAGNSEWCVLFLAIIVMVLMWDTSRIQWRSTDIIFLSVVMVASFIPGSVMAYLGLSYCLARICAMAREWGKRKAVYIGAIVLICLYGTVIPMRSVEMKVRDIPMQQVQLLDIILDKDMESDSRDPLIVLAPQEVMESSRLYGRNIRLLYGKDMWIEGCNLEVADQYPPEYREMYTAMKYDYQNPDMAASKAADLGVGVLILREHMDEEIRQQYGYSEPEDVPGYAVYVRD